MARNSKISPDLRVACPKPCQAQSQNKPSNRKQALVVSKNMYNRFIDYTTEDDRLVELAEVQAAKRAELKKATLEMSKDWDNAITNLQRRRREELLSKKKKADEARVKFVKDLAAKNATERAEVVKEARKLLFYKKPQCRLINSALLTSESYRELFAQLAFRKKLEGLEKEQENIYAGLLKKDTENFFIEKRQKAEKQLNKTRTYAAELKKQIEDIANNIKRIELIEAKADKEDLDNALKEAQTIEECETEERKKKKEYLKKMFLDQLEAKRRVEERLKHEEDIQDRYTEAYRRAREHVNNITKMKWKEEQANKIKRSELMAKKCAVAYEVDEAAEKERIRKAVAEKDKLEAQRLLEKREFKEKMRADLQRYEAEAAVMKEKREEEEKRMIQWETHQRYKRDEYNKNMKMTALKEENRRKREMAEYLRKQMAEQEAVRVTDKIMDDDSLEVQKAIQRTNKKVLEYGQEILDESKNIRPLFPIIKAIQGFKKEVRLLPPKPVEEPVPPKRQRRMKKKCPKPLPQEQAFYLG